MEIFWGENIRKRRKELGLTLKQLSEKTGLKVGTLSNYELGRREPNLKRMLIITEALNVNVTKEALKTMVQKILNKEVVKKVQQYLAQMNWSQNYDYAGEKLNIYLEGVFDTLTEKEYIFRVIKEKRNDYITNFGVLVLKYENFTDDYSKNEALFCIFEDKIDYCFEVKE